MLANGFLYEREMREKDLLCWYDPRYAWYYSWSHAPFTLPTNCGDWDEITLASLNYDGEVIGQITYYVDRDVESVDNLGVINYSQNPQDKIIFGRDLYKAVDAIFTKFGFARLTFSVRVGNPAEPFYDRLAKRAGGRIAGVLRHDAKLSTGEIVDAKIYEIMRDEYMSSKQRKGMDADDR